MVQPPFYFQICKYLKERCKKTLTLGRPWWVLFLSRAVELTSLGCLSTVVRETTQSYILVIVLKRKAEPVTAGKERDTQVWV